MASFNWTFSRPAGGFTGLAQNDGTVPRKRQGQNPFSASGGSGVSLADDQVMNEFLPALQQYENQATLNNWLANNSGWGNPPASKPPTGSTAGTWNVLRNVKNQKVDSLLGGVLDEIGGVSTDATKRQGTLQTYTKSPEMQARINQATMQNDLDTNNVNVSVSDFVKAYMGGQDQQDANAQQEAGRIGEVYDGTTERNLQGTRDKLSADLAAIRGKEKYANLANLSRRIGAIRSARNIGSLSGGVDSFMDRQAQNAVAGASIANDLALAGQEREDVNRLAGMSRDDINNILRYQMGAAGTRNNLLDAAAKRRLLVPEVLNQFSGANAQRLGQIQNLWNANNIYDLQTPQELLAKKMGLLGSATQLSNQNTFYGLEKPYEPDTQGYFPINLPSAPRAYSSNWGGAPVMQYADDQPIDVQASVTPGAAVSAPSRGGWAPLTTGVGPEAGWDYYGNLAPEAQARAYSFYESTGQWPHENPGAYAAMNGSAPARNVGPSAGEAYYTGGSLPPQQEKDALDFYNQFRRWPHEDMATFNSIYGYNLFGGAGYTPAGMSRTTVPARMNYNAEPFA